MANEAKITIDVSVKKFRVPQFLTFTIGEKEQSVPIKDVHSRYLAELADLFRKDLFEAAGKSDPARPCPRND